MGIYDALMLAIVVVAAFLGWRKGMVSQVASIVSLVASFFVAMNFYEQAAVHIKASEPWNKIGGFVLLYLGTALIVWLFFKSIRSSVEQMKLRDFDYQMGALLGAAKGVALACIITLLAVNLAAPASRLAIIQSKSGSVVSRLVHTFGPHMPARMQPFLTQYVQRLDEALGTPGSNPYLDRDPFGQPYADPNSYGGTADGGYGWYWLMGWHPRERGNRSAQGPRAARHSLVARSGLSFVPRFPFPTRLLVMRGRCFQLAALMSCVWNRRR